MQRDSSRVNGGTKGRGGIALAGGGVGTLLLVGIFLALGGSPSDLGALLGGSSTSTGMSTDGAALDHCDTSDSANTYDDCRVLYTAYSVDDVWSHVLPEQAGIAYTQPGVTLFHGSTTSGCGTASASTGPFYCPSDRTVYLDISFFEQLGQLGGSDGPLAQMYIVAHEFGHHIQQLEGTLGLSNYNDPGPDSNAVNIELQADCYGGLWAGLADDGENAMLEPVTDEQVAQAVTTARAVGDDNIQRRSGGDVNPDAFTHGTSEQRQQAFLAGYRSGLMSQCDTLGRGAYQ